MNEEIALLINSLPENVRNVLVSTSGDGKVKLNGNNFTRALDLTDNVNDEAKVIEIYLRTLCENQWKNIGWEKVEPLKDILIRICSEAGLRESENPFIEFLPRILAKTQITREDLIDLNNLYANDELSYEDIAGKGKDGLNHIIFNPSLYKSEDDYMITQIWNWLGDAKNLNKMNWGEVRDANLSNLINDVASNALTQISDGNQISDVSANNYRLDLMFKDGNPSGELNALETLKELLRRGAINKNTTTQTTQTPRKRYSDSSRELEDRLSDYISKTDLTDNEIKEIISQVLRNYGIQ